MEGGKISKLKAKLAELSSQIDDADIKTSDATASQRDANSRLEAAELEIASIQRRIQLIEKDLKDTQDRCDNIEGQLNEVESRSVSVGEARKELEENESIGDEKISILEDRIKEGRQLLEENQTKLTDTERKHVVVLRDIEHTASKADALEKRIEVLENTINSSTYSLKELEEREGESSLQDGRNAEEIALLEGQFKEAEVRAESASRSCNVLEMTNKETETEIESWKKRTEDIIQEIEQMDEMAEIVENE